MRHNKSGRKFSLTPDARKALLRSITDSLVAKGRIKTTVTRAKEVRKIADNLVTLAKKNTLSARREALQWLTTKDAFKRLFSEYADAFKARNGGYTRITKCGYRAGDNAPMAYLEYILETAETKKAAPKRKRRRSTKKADTAETAKAE